MRRVGVVCAAACFALAATAVQSSGPAQATSVDPPWSGSSSISALSQVRPTPVMATADNGTAITVWSQVTSSGGSSWYAPQSSMWNGVGWSAPVNLDSAVKQTSASNPPAPLPDVAISNDGSTAIAVWLQGAAPPFAVRASTAACTTSAVPTCSWTSPVTLAAVSSAAAAISVQPQVAIAGDGDSATVTWIAQGSAGAYDTNGYVYASVWNASSWSAAQNLSNDGATQPGVAMSLHANTPTSTSNATGTIVTWTASNPNTKQNQIEFQTRRMQGGLWSGIDYLAGVPSAVGLDAVQPDISDDGSSAVVAYAQDGLLEGSAWASIVNDTGYPWKRGSFDPHQLSTQNAGYPSAAISRNGNKVLTAWGQEVGNDFMLVSQTWTDGGANGSWAAMSNVTSNADPDAAVPQAAIDSSNTLGGVSFCMQSNGVGYAPWTSGGGFGSIEQINGSGCSTQLGLATNGTSILTYSAPGSGATGSVAGAVATSGTWPSLSFSPSVGVWTGGTTTTVDTSKLPGVLQAISFDGTPGTITGTTSQGVTSVTVPKHSGADPTGNVDVLVQTTLGSHRYKNAFTYVNPPVLSGASPSVAPAGVEQYFGLYGSGLSGVTAAAFGGVSELVAVATNTAVTAGPTPVLSAGLYSISVSGPGYGTSNTLTNALRMIPAPQITSVSPTSGEAGSAVVISGSGLTYATTVTFGGVAAANITVIDDSTITAFVPAHADGLVAVQVTTPAGTATRSNAFEYVTRPGPQPPMITYVAPAIGAAGITVTISGDHFTAASAVTFNATNATSYTVLDDQTITAVVPAGTGTKDVSVTTANGTATATNAFTYATPTVVSVSPQVGSTQGGTEITLTGTNLTGVSAITVGGNPVGSFSQISDESVTAITPAGSAGLANIQVASAAGTSILNGAFTYIAPAVVASLAPTTGPASGGTSVTLTGSGFSGATAVTIGGVDAAAYTVVNDSTILATTPQHDSGSVDVTVTTAVGTSLSQNAFTFIAAPVIDQISPVTGTTDGGTSITITGRNLSDATVTIAGVPATVTVDGATAIMVLAPAGEPGAVDVAVTTVGGAVTALNGYTYVTPAPNPGPTPPAPIPPAPLPVATVISTKATSPKHAVVKAKISVAPAFGRTGKLQQFVKRHRKWQWVNLGHVVDFSNRAKASTTVTFKAKKGHRTFRVQLPMTTRGNAATQEFSVKVK